LIEFIPRKAYNRLRPGDKPWMNGEIRRAQRRRDRFHKAAKTKNTNDSWARYRAQRNYVTTLIHQAKREHDISVIDSINSMSSSDANWWKIVKTVFGASRDSIPALRYDDQDETRYADDDKSKADLLNDIFVKSSDVKDADKEFPEQLPRTDARLDHITVLEGDVLEAINSIFLNKAAGPDSITPFILHKISLSITPILVRLFNRSLSDNEFPSSWKDNCCTHPQNRT